MSVARPPPRQLGRYELLGTLARGGMATVYLGRHLGGGGFQRLCAIKIMHPHLAEDEGFVTMLIDEARIAARLHHPNIVPIVDLGTQEGIHYVVMEYIEGCSLSALLLKNRDKRPANLLVSIFLDTLAGLHAAHTLTDDDDNPMNIVHRDVSPQNILVGVDGTGRITDFGIAKAEAQMHHTRPGQLKGKFGYMSPEQIKETSAADARSDVFSAGIILWSALTGRKLFAADGDAQTLHNVLAMEVPTPSKTGHCPPAALDPVILRALERDPSKRFQSAAEMEEALREAATTAGLLGSKKQVGDFVSSSFTKELADRRAAIRVAAGQGAKNETSSGISQSSSLRMIPALGPTSTDASTPSSTPSIEAPSSTPSPGASSPALDGVSGPHVEFPSSSTLVMANPDAARKKRVMRLLLTSVGIGGACGTALVGWLALRSAAESAPAARAAATETIATTTMPSATVAAIPAPTATDEKSADSTKPTTDKPAAKIPTHGGQPPSWSQPRSLPPALATKPLASATTTATSQPPAPDGKKKSVAWDNDSPLPPP